MSTLDADTVELVRLLLDPSQLSVVEVFTLLDLVASGVDVALEANDVTLSFTESGTVARLEHVFGRDAEGVPDVPVDSPSAIRTLVESVTQSAVTPEIAQEEVGPPVAIVEVRAVD